MIRGDFTSAYLDGQGHLVIDGDWPRLFFVPPSGWGSVVGLTYLTLGGFRPGVTSSDGLYISRGDRLGTPSIPLGGLTYDTRFLWSAHWNVQKEVVSERAWSTAIPSYDYVLPWFNQLSFPTGRKVGVMVRYTPVNDGKWVEIQAWRDLSGTGDWQKVDTVTDYGQFYAESDNPWNQQQVENYIKRPFSSPYPGRASEAHIRLDHVKRAVLQDTAVYEADPDPSLYSFEGGLQGMTVRGSLALSQSTAHCWKGKYSAAATINGTGYTQVSAKPSGNLAGKTLVYHYRVGTGSSLKSVNPFVQVRDAGGNWYWLGAWTSNLNAGSWSARSLQLLQIGSVAAAAAALLSAHPGQADARQAVRSAAEAVGARREKEGRAQARKLILTPASQGVLLARGHSSHSSHSSHRSHSSHSSHCTARLEEVTVCPARGHLRALLPARRLTTRSRRPPLRRLPRRIRRSTARGRPAGRDRPPAPRGRLRTPVCLMGACPTPAGFPCGSGSWRP
jgi:hypothetical protein